MRAIAILVAAAFVWSAAAPAATRVVGGTTIDIQQAPWQVAVLQSRGFSSALCGGSIIDPLRVVTAAHCVYDPAGAAAAATGLTIRAGISNFTGGRGSDRQQDRAVTSVRIHPGYVQSSASSADDVAVLTLDAPLDLSGPTAKAIALPAPATPVSGGQAVSLGGFGREVAGGTPDGTLNWMDGVLSDPPVCGPNNAVLLCASSTTSSPCSGDSGSALTVAAPDRIMVGITSTAVLNCMPGRQAYFTNVAAPEILTFIQGTDSPPTAPRQTTDSGLAVPRAMQVGQKLTCVPGNWTGGATFAYTFLDARTAAVLQAGAQSAYTLAARDLGRTVECRVVASNAGGTGSSETSSTQTLVRPAPRITAASAAVQPGKRAVFRVTVAGLTGVSGGIEICVRPPLSVAGKGCGTTRASGFASTAAVLVGAAVKPSAPARTFRVAVTARLADGRKLGFTGSLRVAR